MKNQKNSLFKVIPFFAMFLALLLIGACGSREGSSSKEESSSSGKPPKPPDMDIHAAAVMGDLDVIKQHIEAGTDLNTKEPSVGSTPLITAAVFGKTEVAVALIEAGADLNYQNQEGSTALHTAAFLCRMEIVESLLENGADKSLQNIYGSTPYESVAGPFSEVSGIYDVFSKDLGPFGLKLDYQYLEETRPKIAEMLK